MEKSYIVVGNFQTVQALSGEFRNLSSGVSQSTFFNLMQKFAKARGLDIVDFSDNTIVMTGDAQDYHSLEKATGDSYSLACIGEDSFAKFSQHMNSGPMPHLNA